MKTDIDQKVTPEVIGYIAPDNSTISLHDYEYLSTNQTKTVQASI